MQKELIITTLSKQFLLVIFLFLTIFLFFIFIFSNIKTHINYSQKISSITKFSNFAYSNNIFETRIKEQNDFSRTLFLMPIQINYLDFIYEK